VKAVIYCNCSLYDMPANNPFRVSHSIDHCNITISCSSLLKHPIGGAIPVVPSIEYASSETPPSSQIHNSNNPYNYITSSENCTVPNSSNMRSQSLQAKTIFNTCFLSDLLAFLSDHFLGFTHSSRHLRTLSIVEATCLIHHKLPLISMPPGCISLPIQFRQTRSHRTDYTSPCTVLKAENISRSSSKPL
jgi:hypothetical protein